MLSLYGKTKEGKVLALNSSAKPSAAPKNLVVFK